MWMPPAAIATAGPGRLTGTGVGCPVVVPSPSSPSWFSPHVHTVPDASSAAAKS